jgi:chromosome segregation ATPase
MSAATTSARLASIRKTQTPRRSAERIALAGAIESRDELMKRLDAIEKAASATRTTAAGLRAQIERFDDEVKDAKAQAASAAVAAAMQGEMDGADAPAGIDLKALRAAHAEVKDQLDIAIQTQAELDKQQREISGSLQLSEMGVRAAVIEVVKSDASVRKLAEDFLVEERHLAEQRQALEFLAAWLVLPADLKGAACTKDRPPPGAGVAAWRKALGEDLSRDADTPLPLVL